MNGRQEKAWPTVNPDSERWASSDQARRTRESLPAVSIAQDSANGTGRGKKSALPGLPWVSWDQLRTEAAEPPRRGFRLQVYDSRKQQRRTTERAVEDG